MRSHLARWGGGKKKEEEIREIVLPVSGENGKQIEELRRDEVRQHK